VTEQFPSIALSEFPKPDQADQKLIILLDNENVMATVLQRCEELGWRWMGGNELATQFTPTIPKFIRLGFFYPSSPSFRLLCLYNLHQQSWLEKEGFRIYNIAFVDSGPKIINLKAENTKLGATACASCGGKLKNPMPGMLRFQHCPVCEP
jgi:hypothetical protein